MTLPEEIAAKLLSGLINDQTPALVLVVREGDQAIVDADLRSLGEVSALLRLAKLHGNPQDQKTKPPHHGGNP